MVKFEKCTLHTMATLPNPRRVALFLAEKGIEVDQRVVNIELREHKSEEFEKRNMDTRVPVLELEDGTHISESVAIVQYIEEMTPSSKNKLFGDNALERARVSMWNRRIDIEFIGYVTLATRYGPFSKALQYPKNDEIRDDCLRVARGFLTRLDKDLENKKFLTFDDRISMADISLFCWLDFCEKNNEWDLVGSNTNLKRWYEAMLERESVKATPGLA